MSDPSPLADNPLLDAATLPRFDAIEGHHVEPAIRHLIEVASAAFDALERDATPTWDGLIEPLERLQDPLGRAWGAVRHLSRVANTPALREAIEATQPDVIAFYTRMGQSEALFGHLTTLREGAAWDALAEGQQRIITQALRSARHSGVALDGEARERFNAIRAELAQLSNRFRNNILDATRAWSHLLTDPDEVRGLPETTRRVMASAARSRGHENASAEDGPWAITLDAPCMRPFLANSPHRHLRRKAYDAYFTLASDGDGDNTPLIQDLLRLRHEQAQLLGYTSYAELSLASKMADDVSAVETFLDTLRDAALSTSRDELETLTQLAQAHPDTPDDFTMEAWDIGYWSERLREANYAYNGEQLRPWFPFPHVLQGLFDLIERLFGVQMREVPADDAPPAWHDDVRFFHVFEPGQDAPIAAFFLDPYSRPGTKSGGAWHVGCIGRSAVLAPEGSDVRIPVSHIICNQTPPVDGAPSLMSLAEVTTLFHEFGHALQFLLTRVPYSDAAGYRGVEWDAVEIPSMFLQRWCEDRPTLKAISRHIDTQEPLTDAWIDKLEAARNHMAAYNLTRQLRYTVVDLTLHHHYDPRDDQAPSPHAIYHNVQRAWMAVDPLDYDRFLCGFAHIFAGGYAAGYYSYLWSNAIAADAFAAFTEGGADPDTQQAAGRRWRDTFLALGGSRHPLDVFRDFRGRDPDPKALLRELELLAA